MKKVKRCFLLLIFPMLAAVFPLTACHSHEAVPGTVSVYSETIHSLYAVNDFENGLAVIVVVNAWGERFYGVVDVFGELIIPLEYDSVSLDFFDDYVMITTVRGVTETVVLFDCKRPPRLRKKSI